MTLRRKLILLHSAFAAFAVAAASATIYGVQLHVRDAVTSFERLVDRSNVVDQLRVAVLSQLVELHDIVGKRREISFAYLERRDAFFTRFSEVANFAGARVNESSWRSILQVQRDLKDKFDECLSLVRASRHEEADALLTHRIERELLPGFDAQLREIKASLDDARRVSINEVVATDTQLLALAGVISASCAVLVAAGAALVRRWLIKPIAQLQTATAEFANGNLAHRVMVPPDDELGSLGLSLNEMAASLGESQTKYRSLFENLRDAVIICDGVGVVVECRDSDTGLLGLEPGEAIGRPLLEIWPNWQSTSWDWNHLIARVQSTAQQSRAVDVELPSARGKRAIVDVVTYPVEYGNRRYAAIVLRDVTERNRLQRLARRAETMEAAETFARGIAHDFKNLLNSAVTSLSLIASKGSGNRDGDRARTALHACRQAASLSRRLLDFATTDDGNPQVFCLTEMLELILDSLDEPFLAPLRIQTELSRSAFVRMDRDQLTQVMLNLIHNAREAMPEGGCLRITTAATTASNPVGDTVPSTYSVVTVTDTGCGMTSEVKERLFEPFFTTKARGSHGRRGMGLAVVYAAVRNAGGFIQIDSEIDTGTTFRVYLPVGEEVLSPT